MTFRLWVLGWFCWKLRLRLFKIAGLLMQVCKCIPIEVNRIESNKIERQHGIQRSRWESI